MYSPSHMSLRLYIALCQLPELHKLGWNVADLGAQLGQIRQLITVTTVPKEILCDNGHLTIFLWGSVRVLCCLMAPGVSEDN